MVYPVVMKQLLVSNLLGKFAVPFRPAVATEAFNRFSPAYGRRSYYMEVRDEFDHLADPYYQRKEDDENCYLFIHMPGIKNQLVKSYVTCYRSPKLNIGGEVVQKDYQRIVYKSSFELPKHIKMSGIIAHMNDGVLTVTLPKLKEGEEKPDVYDVKID